MTFHKFEQLFFSVDITLYHNGFHGDLNETFFVGNIDEESKRLVKVTHESFMQAIAAGVFPQKLTMLKEL